MRGFVCVLLLWGLLLWGGATRAQLLPFLPARDTSYVQGYHELITVRPFAQARYNSILIGHRDAARDMEYVANTPLAIGAGIYWRMLGLSYSVDIPLTRPVEGAPTRYFDFQYHYYGQFVVLDAYAFRYKGFFRREEDAVDFFPQIFVERYGFRLHHPLLGQNFSFAAAFEQSERQRRWAYSFPLGLGVYYQNLELNHRQVREQTNSDFLGEVYGGAAIVYPFEDFLRGCYVAGEVTLGTSLALSGESLRRPHPCGSWEVRTSFGYTRREWSLALTLFYHSLGIVENVAERISGESGTLEFAFSWRFYREAKD